MEELTLHKQYFIRQVAATMEIEDMPLDEQTYTNLTEIVTGKRTAEQVITEIKKEYING